MTTGAYRVEMTDTYAGEANYCWVRRATIPSSVTGDAPDNGRTYRRRLARAALSAVGADAARAAAYAAAARAAADAAAEHERAIDHALALLEAAP